MAEIQNNDEQPITGRDKKEQAVVDRLVFAALREQTRARRWRIGFMLFFIIYLQQSKPMLISNSFFLVN